MARFVRSLVVALLACSAFAVLVNVPPARAGRRPIPDSEWALATTTVPEPICDLFANGYDATGAAPCASCFDKTQDFDETDVDCGGSYCGACALGLQCMQGSDCLSGKCASGVCVDGLVISQVQTRGDNGGNDEFVELYNPGSGPVIFDDTWTLQGRSATSPASCTTGASPRFAGGGQIIAPHGHLLFVNSAAYNGPTAGDATYTTGITDAASLVLQHGAGNVDALCFYYDATTQSALATCAVAYVCEGTPVANPHNNTSGTDVDASLERKPGGDLGNTQDTGDSATDFVTNTNPDPHNQASGGVP